jgi:hypothetical protein
MIAALAGSVTVANGGLACLSTQTWRNALSTRESGGRQDELAIEFWRLAVIDGDAFAQIAGGGGGFGLLLFAQTSQDY